jgi:hypothetical protein
VLAGPITFATAPAPGDETPFTLLAFGDSGDGTSAQTALAAQMAHESFDLVLHAGDVVYPSGSVPDYGPRFFTPYASIIAGHCVFPTLGNHDLDDPTAPGYFDAFSIARNNPENSGHYYSFVWGGTKIVSIDTWSSFQTTGPPPAMMTWLQNELASSTSRWLVVLMHVPAFSSGAIFSQSQPLRTALVPLFEQLHVDLVVQGHDHAYERTVPISSAGRPAVTYVTTGGGGGDLLTVPTTSNTAVRSVSTHYLLVDVSHASLHLRAIELGGASVDDFTLSKP